MEVLPKNQVQCYHCGADCNHEAQVHEQRHFCCPGCLGVYQLLRDHQLHNYYQLNKAPGASTFSQDTYAFLDEAQIQQRLLQFSSEEFHIVTLKIPQIHCSSCIWLLEHLQRLHSGVLSSRVNFTKKEVTVRFDPRLLTLRGLVEMLSAIGYEPSLRLNAQNEQAIQSGVSNEQDLLIKIGVAGFCFGNIMLLSFPEYLGLQWDPQGRFTHWFSGFMLVLSLPVVFYCAQDYFKGALHGLAQRYLNIEVPIALGITALFLQSVWEIFSGTGPGYLDSLAGLLFLLLLGKWFQQRTYQGLSFDRDYTAYFPMAVTKVEQGKEQPVMVTSLKPGDEIILHNQHLIPTDALNLERKAEIDYSFVTGESDPVTVEVDSYIYAGGRHLGPRSRYRVIKPVDQSYLTQLWNHGSFSKAKPRDQLVNQVSKYFTPIILLVATFAGFYWWWVQPEKALFAFTAVLIVACPCALSMTTPFTLGSALRTMGLNGLYLKNAHVVETLSGIDQIVFDKTGTLTRSNYSIDYKGNKIDIELASNLLSLLVQSNHPRSKELAGWLKKTYGDLPVHTIDEYCERPGVGIEGITNGHTLKVGRFSEQLSEIQISELWVGDKMWGVFEFTDLLREDTNKLLTTLRQLGYKLGLLSGDHAGKEQKLRTMFKSHEKLEFGCSPHDKLESIRNRQEQNAQVLMLGDGLNDAGALKRSDVGIAISNDAHHFTPASDAIMLGNSLIRLPTFLRLANASRSIIITGFVLSFLYNIVGLTLAVTAQLTPLFAAILMPLSSITVVVFSTLSVTIVAKYLKLK